MKTLEILDFVKTAKTRKQLREQFGPFVTCMANLIRKGAIRKFDGANDDQTERYSRAITTYYVATGKPYITNFTESQYCHQPHVRLNDEQFAALTVLVRINQESASGKAARLVFVSGFKPSYAASASGISASSVTSAVRRCQKGVELALAVTQGYS